MQSLLPKDDEPIRPIQPPQQQAPQQTAPPQGYQNYPPQNYPPQGYPQQNYAPPQQSAPVNYGPPPSGSNLKTSILMGAVLALVGAKPDGRFVHEHDQLLRAARNAAA